jgi:FkbM family methyltransferase
MGLSKNKARVVPTSTVLAVAFFALFGSIQVFYALFVSSETSVSLLHGEGPPMLTLGEMKRTMKLPCNYVHDGFFVPHSNEITNQVYQTLMELDDDDIVPVVIEVGAHDGITKSMSLKTSMCLQANVLLIEASPTNYKVLEQARSYDTTVNAALCEGEYAELEESEKNSGQSHILQGDELSKRTRTVRVPCTTLDKELDKLKAKLPLRLRSKMQLVFLVLDVEGVEATAVKGLKRYSPKKAYIEWTRVSDEDNRDMMRWATGHNLKGDYCGPLKRDKCFNFHQTLFFGDNEPLPWMRDVFYGARMEHPEHSATTSKVSKSYIFYGE